MIRRWIAYKNGYVHTKMKSASPERFFQLCANHGITIFHLKKDKDVFYMDMRLRDFLLLRPLCRKSKTKIRILEKHGLPFFFYKNKKRKAFFLGMLLCILLLFYLSSRIWNIHIEGNYRCITQDVLEYLEEQSVTHGIKKSTINCKELAFGIRRQFPEIIWVSARIVGTRLIVTVQENQDTPSPKEEEDAWDLIAEKSGTVERMAARKGVPQVTVGQKVEKGDLLIMGRLEIKNDSQEVVRYEYVSAEGDVYVKNSYPYYLEFPLKHQKKEYTGKEKSEIFLRVFQKQFEMFSSSKREGHWEAVTIEQPISVTENFQLPISFGKTVYREYVNKAAIYTKNEAIQLAEHKMQLHLEKLLEKGVEISDNNVKIKVDSTSCRAEGTITVIEQIGKRVPAKRLREPQERITVDEQHN